MGSEARQVMAVAAVEITGICRGASPARPAAASTLESPLVMKPCAPEALLRQRTDGSSRSTHPMDRAVGPLLPARSTPADVMTKASVRGPCPTPRESSSAATLLMSKRRRHLRGPSALAASVTFGPGAATTWVGPICVPVLASASAMTAHVRGSDATKSMLIMAGSVSPRMAEAAKSVVTAGGERSTATAAVAGSATFASVFPAASSATARTSSVPWAVATSVEGPPPASSHAATCCSGDAMASRAPSKPTTPSACNCCTGTTASGGSSGAVRHEADGASGSAPPAPELASWGHPGVSVSAGSRGRQPAKVASAVPVGDPTGTATPEA
mmetsp:Transcript_2717/g.10931  ORF Transcript_2717/g.10931 Transcript_2717/m.10931 type:complete len:328 (+) Transcript_2717:8063-9046(+)